jgi:hypothetical protein
VRRLRGAEMTLERRHTVVGGLDERRRVTATTRRPGTAPVGHPSSPHGLGALTVQAANGRAAIHGSLPGMGRTPRNAAPGGGSGTHLVRQPPA